MYNRGSVRSLSLQHRCLQQDTYSNLRTPAAATSSPRHSSRPLPCCRPLEGSRNSTWHLGASSRQWRCYPEAQWRNFSRSHRGRNSLSADLPGSVTRGLHTSTNNNLTTFLHLSHNLFLTVRPMLWIFLFVFILFQCSVQGDHCSAPTSPQYSPRPECKSWTKKLPRAALSGLANACG